MMCHPDDVAAEPINQSVGPTGPGGPVDHGAASEALGHHADDPNGESKIGHNADGTPYYRGELPLPKLGKPERPKVTPLASRAELRKPHPGKKLDLRVRKQIDGANKEMEAQQAAWLKSPESKKPLTDEEKAAALPKDLAKKYRSSPDAREAATAEFKRRELGVPAAQAGSDAAASKYAHDQELKSKLDMATPAFRKKFATLKPEEQAAALDKHLQDRGVVNSAIAPISNAISKMRRDEVFERQRQAERDKKPPSR